MSDEKIGKDSEVVVSRVDTQESHEQQSTPSADVDGDAEPQGKWTRSLFRFGPLSGIFCMLLALASIIASLGILAGSNGRDIATWTTPPSTYIAIFTAVANLSVRYAAVQGVVVAWWMRALKGSTLAKLQYDWRSGSSLLGALTAGRNIGLLGLACIFSTLVVIDGPLLQRASTVVKAEVGGQPLTLDVKMAQEVPRGSTGWWGTSAQFGLPGSHASASWNDTVPTPDGSAPNNIMTTVAHAWLDVGVNKLWWNDSSLGNVVQGCSGECKASIRAPALFPTVPCVRKSVPLDYVETWNLNEFVTNRIAPPLSTNEFMISVAFVLDEVEKIAIITGYSTVESESAQFANCRANFVYDTCLFAAGIGEYDVHIEADEIEMTSLSSPRLVGMSNNTSVDLNINEQTGLHPSTLGGVFFELKGRWDWKPTKGQATAETYSPFPVQIYYKEGSKCPSYHNPQTEVISSVNKLLFYTGAVIGARIAEGHDVGEMDPGLPVSTTVQGVPEGKQDVFRTHYAFFIAAAMVELVCVLLIAPTYWGWWRLGRAVSFSPLQIAKAFEAPLLSNCSSNGTDRGLAKAVKDTQVRYGVVSARESGGVAKLAFGEPTSRHIVQPQLGQQFDA